MSYRIDHFEIFDDVAEWPEALKPMHAAWDRLRQGRPLPRREDFDPMALPRHLPNLLLVDIAPDGDDFTYRVVGTRVTDYMEFDRTGQSASEAYADDPGFGNVLKTLAKRLQETGKPFAVTAALYWVDRDHITLDAGIYPLTDDAGAVTMALVECLFRGTSPSG